MTGEVTKYIEDEKLVIQNDADGELYYFSVDSDTVISGDDIEEGDEVTVAYTGDITGNDLVPVTKITKGSSGSRTTGTGASSPSAKGETISGTVTAASMNTVTIETSGGTTYTFSTMDADIAITGGLEEGMDVTLHYNGDLSEGAEDVTVTSVEEDK